MKAIRIEQLGGPEMMKFVDVETPKPGAGEVLVRHRAIGVNYIDVYFRTGVYPQPVPAGIGAEAAGVVEAVGEGVTRFKIGERIAYCMARPGSYAEAHVVSADMAVKLPDAISDDVAASSLLKGLTAHYLLRKTFPVQQQHVALIHAAAGGVGQILVQWAKHLGARVIATVGSEPKRAIAKTLGADDVIVTQGADIAKQVRALTAGEGVDVVYDGVGKDTFEASLDSLKPLGMMVSYGNASGVIPPFSPVLLSVKGSLYFTRPGLAAHMRTPRMVDENAAELFEAITSGVVKIAPPTRYKLADAAQAHIDLEARKTTGSLVLIP